MGKDEIANILHKNPITVRYVQSYVFVYDGFQLRFSHSVMYNPFPNKPWFLRVCSTSLLKTLWEKETLLVTSNISFSHSVFFHPLRELLAIFFKSEIVVCKLFLVWQSLKSVEWESDNIHVKQKYPGISCDCSLRAIASSFH